MTGKSQFSTWMKTIGALAIVPMVLFIIIYLVDFYWIGAKSGDVGVVKLFYRLSVEDSRQVLGGMGEVIAAILGIVITVASIIVQLAATRYTPRITEMFFKDRTNLIILAFFVVSAIFCLWVNFVIRGGLITGNFIPVLGAITTVLMLTISILMIAPYFLYVFEFLDPSNIVKGIKNQAVDKFSHIKDSSQVPAVQSNTILSVEQLADISMNAVEQKDKGLATGAVDSLLDLIREYLAVKKQIPEGFFRVSHKVKTNPDFISMHTEVLQDISKKRTWLEYKVLRQYQMLYNESLNKMRDIDYIIAIDTRYLGEEAIVHQDIEVLKLVIKFFNTFMRATLNARDVRTAYNILHQYRLLAEAVLRAGMDDQVLEIAGYFKYYGQLAFSMKISFITETVAYDLTSLCELAFSAGAPVGSDLLGVLLEVDKEAEGEQQENSLRGVRKAQIKMATYFLLLGDEEKAHLIYEDMKHEPRDRILSIKKELMSVESK
ncbi:DUF2254 domain-containing protein, partial [Myxococcota bacterium]|nr:DUF2254 domain-containing protein [Myxococcota bacterium]